MTDEQFYTVYRDNELITTTGNRIISVPICPDLLDYELIGAADNWRGRVVRAFFWVMRIWPV